MRNAFAEDLLQLCRPLSGAVRFYDQYMVDYPKDLQLCRPLSGAVRGVVALALLTGGILQLCRPLSGAVSGPAWPWGVKKLDALQLCRPLSGAVSCLRLPPAGYGQAPSIVPPPFGSG